MSHAEIAHEYARAVVSGQIPACKLVVQACQRQLDDLESPPHGYHFDEARAGRVCKFVELCPHIKGALARQEKLLTLEPWQVFILSTVFGWVDDNGNRRFRRAYTEVPRGNGKSSLSSPLGLYALALDSEAGAEVYSAATTRDQARIVFRDAQAMARKMGGFRNRFGVTVPAQAIVQESTASSFKALSADGNTLDGLNIHMAIVDELHAHKTPDVYEVLETGLGKRPQSLLWLITTAGTNKHGVCYSVRGDIVQILSGAIDGTYAETTFGIIYTTDEGDDPYDEATIRKANPNYGVSVDPAHIMQLADKARRNPTARANFYTKHLNKWVDANTALFDTEHWRAGEDKALNEADFMADEIVIALDLASKIDIAAKVNVYRRVVGAAAHYYVFPTFYLPQAAIENDVHPMFRPWEMQGDLTVTAGETTDFSVIEDEIRIEAPGRNVVGVSIDPWQGQQMLQNLQRDGLPAQEYKMNVGSMSEATKTVDALMREGRIHHTGNAVMNWMIGNVVGHFDAKDNVYPRKELPGNKIDGAVALIMAIGTFLNGHENEESYLNVSGLMVL